MRMKWETLKEKVILCAMGNVPYCYVEMAPLLLQECLAEGNPDWKGKAEKWRQEVIKVIKRWDIRRVKALIDLFPGAVPKYCLGLVPKCYMADDKDSSWVVEFEQGGSDVEC